MKKIPAFLLMATLFITGCANHVQQDVLSAENIQRERLSETVSATPLQGTISPQGGLESSSVVLRYDTIIQEKVTRENVTRVMDLSTPYSPVRELYELPVGIVAIAGGVVINVLDFALLGLLPNVMTDAPLAVGFAGINPFMNIESKNRVVSKLVSSDTIIMDEKTEVTTIPLAGKTVTFISGDRSLTAQTGEDGVVSAFVAPLVNSTATTLSVTLEGQEDKALTVYVPRLIRRQAEEAQTIMSKYVQDSETLAKTEILEQDLERLESLGYHDYVQQIERGL